MTHPALIERITRSLAYMLRHQPEKFDLELDSQGWGELEDVVRALNEKLGEPIEEQDVRNAIVAGDRPRYEIRATRVRALYGHSIEVEPGEPSKPPEFLYVGVAGRDAERARKFGLRGGRRRFLHLARTAEEAREAGRRTGREYAVLTVFALDAWEEGVNFYDRQALFLAEEVPTQFIELEGEYSDGYDTPARPEQGARGPRGGEGRRDGRERDRGGREDRPRPAHSGGPSRGPREERGPREDRGPRPEREPRFERGPREDRPPRREEPKAPAPPRESAPAPRPAAGPSSSDFGLGVFEPEPSPPPRRPTPPPPPPGPPPAPRVEPARSDDSNFGAGL
jgi:putative RNA 2'-phosphotransferase